MSFGAYFVILLIAQRYLQVAHCEETQNLHPSDQNVSLVEVKILSEEDTKLNVTSKNENISLALQFVKHESKKNNTKHKPSRQINEEHMVSSTTEGDESPNDRTMKRSIDTLTRKVSINDKPPCEAMVLTYGPIGFTSALELIGNAGREPKQSCRRSSLGDPSNSSGGRPNDSSDINKRTADKTPAVMVTSDTKQLHEPRKSVVNLNTDRYHYKEEEFGNFDDNERLFELERNKRNTESNIRDNGATQELDYSGYVINRNGLNVAANKVVASDTLKKDRFKNKYSTLGTLQNNFPGLNLNGGTEHQTKPNPVQKQISDSSSRRAMFNPKSKFNLQNILNEAEHVLIVKQTMDKSLNVDKNEKTCPKQPKFIDKITIDKGSYNLNQNIGKHRGIDTKYAQEHFRAKTKQLTPFEEQTSGYNNEKTGVRKYDEKKEQVSLLHLEDSLDEEINKTKSTDKEIVQQKLIKKRYIPDLHPMPETEEDRQRKLTLAADYLKISGGSKKYDGKTREELKNELLRFFNTWPKTREWMHSDRHSTENKNGENVANPKFSLPVDFYQQPSRHDQFPGNFVTGNMYGQTIRGSDVEREGTCVCAYDTMSGHLESELPGHLPSYQEVYDTYMPLKQETNDRYTPLKQEAYDRYTPLKQEAYDSYTPLKQDVDHQVMPSESINEANFYPVDYRYLAPNNEHQNSFVSYETEQNGAIESDKIPGFGYQEEKSLKIPTYPTNPQYYSYSDFLQDPEPLVSAFKQIIGDKDDSNLKIMKVRFKPTDDTETNKKGKRKTEFYKYASPSIPYRKNKSKRKRNYS